MAGRGRPRKAAAEHAQTKTLSLYPDDLARLQGLMVRLRCSESEVVRRLLKIGSGMTNAQIAALNDE
jgi:hypothetical protein